MVNTPSWHKLENSVLQNSPTNWEDARKEAGLTWEVYTAPVNRTQANETGYTTVRSANYQAICRDDKSFTDPTVELAIQKKSYQVITNAAYGEVIDTVMGLNEDEMVGPDGELLYPEPVTFEALMALYGGRQIVALIKFDEPLKMDWDPSKTYRYMCMSSRHDGQGGLRGFGTNVRVQCANTHSWAEATDGKRNGFTIKHTANWEERLAEVARGIALLRGESTKWLKFAEELAGWQADINDRERYLKRFLPVSDDMSEQKVENVQGSRESIRTILRSETCEGIAWTGYGLLMATTEWNDHNREYLSTDTYVSRQLLHKEPLKARGAKILLQMAKS
jgi:phage/plasmid-like protein (TIGR03299 family)